MGKIEDSLKIITKLDAEMILAVTAMRRLVGPIAEWGKMLANPKTQDHYLAAIKNQTELIGKQGDACDRAADAMFKELATLDGIIKGAEKIKDIKPEALAKSKKSLVAYAAKLKAYHQGKGWGS